MQFFFLIYRNLKFNYLFSKITKIKNESNNFFFVIVSLIFEQRNDEKRMKLQQRRNELKTVIRYLKTRDCLQRQFLRKYSTAEREWIQEREKSRCQKRGSDKFFPHAKEEETNEATKAKQKTEKDEPIKNIFSSKKIGLTFSFCFLKKVEFCYFESKN